MAGLSHVMLPLSRSTAAPSSTSPRLIAANRARWTCAGKSRCGESAEGGRGVRLTLASRASARLAFTCAAGWLVLIFQIRFGGVRSSRV